VNDNPVMDTATEIYDALRSKGIDALMDDRDLRAGFKFKDADLIGIPVCVVVGERNLKDGVVEIKLRQSGEVRKVKKEDALKELEEIVRQ